MIKITDYLSAALQAFTILLLILLTCVVLLGVGFRYLGGSLIWYDEVASVLLAWITFLGAALAMLRNAHIGFSGILYHLSMPARRLTFGLVEVVVIGSLTLIGWASYAVMAYFGSESLVSVPWVPRTAVQGVLPVSLGLMVVARLVTLQVRWRETREGLDPDEKEIRTEIARSQAQLKDYQERERG
jgi:TRAP-type C4-dicarboxylate transport system permease small subunit|tara:strand:+ start:2001 stop:2558 length:558 start_codon:yes stop_codon:yes gene_type:complete